MRGSDTRVPLLLTATRERQRKTFDHNLYAVLISLGIGSRPKMTHQDAQTLMLAALLHDLGEMYINPEYLQSQHRLAPKDWKHVAAHPIIGRMLIQDLTKLPTAVGERVAMSGSTGAAIRTMWGAAGPTAWARGWP